VHVESKGVDMLVQIDVSLKEEWIGIC
jgi:hypothetical protein